jgi:hypothetical protein
MGRHFAPAVACALVTLQLASATTTVQKWVLSNGVYYPDTGLRADAQPLDATFWAQKCQELPPSTEFIFLCMAPSGSLGSAVSSCYGGTSRPAATKPVSSKLIVWDFFKPVEGSTWCDMLVSVDKHMWSPDAITWWQPGYDDFFHKQRYLNTI